MDAEKQFEELAEEVSQRAVRIDCDTETYQRGLWYIIDQLRVDIMASEETSGTEED